MDSWSATLAFVGSTIFAMLQIMSTDGNMFSDKDLQRVITIHRTNCLDKYLCSPAPPTTMAPLQTSIDEFGNVDVVHSPFVQGPDGSCCFSYPFEPCSCDTVTCSWSGTCCSDTFTYLPTVAESETKRKITCEPAQYRLYDVKDVYPTYLMYRKCPDDFVDHAVREKCERPHDVEPQDLSLFIPVTVLSSGHTYQNMFCASCYNIPDSMVTYWDVKVECSRSTIFLPGDVSTILTDVRRTEDCNVVYAPSSGLLNLPLCDALVHSCNASGLWATYDPVIEAACHAYYAPFDSTFQNIFCYICNKNDTLPLNCVYNSGRTGVIVSFSAILSVPKRLESTTEPPPSRQTECRPDQVLDPLKEQCRDVMCLPPRKYINGSCKNIIEVLRGLRLGFYIKMTPLNRTMETDDIDSLAESFRAYLLNLVMTTNAYHSLLSIETYFKVSTEVQHTTMSTSWFIHYLVFYMKLYSNPKFNMDSLQFLDAMTQMHGTTKTIYIDGSNRTEDCKMELAQYSPFQTGLNTNLKYIAGIDGSIAALYWQENPMLPDTSPVDEPVTVITATYVCILLDVSDYTLSFDKEGVFVKDLDEVFSLNVYIRRHNIDGLDNKTLQYLCMDEVMPFMERKAAELANEAAINKPTQFTEDGSSEAEGILSLVCVILSLVCLVLSLLTYSLFKVLRTQPGINNMCLIVCLICAQSLYQFGAGQSERVSNAACSVIGILVHFMWLMVIFWMNVCSFHMFRVFRKMNSISNNDISARTTVLYMVYCLVASGVFVSINVAISHTRSSDGGHFGYGGELCYISDRFMAIYTFAIPVAVVIKVNIILFIIVIIQLARLPSMEQSTKNNRNYFKIYAKLSTITGLTWLFGFLIFTDVEAFRFIFIIFTACQGLFIFFAFICNKRVYILYVKLVTGQRKKSSSGSTKSTAYATSSKTT